MITINFKDFTANEITLSNLYATSEYDEKFKIITNDGEVHSVVLVWEQGRYNNYRFITSSENIIWPSDVTHIEVK